MTQEELDKLWGDPQYWNSYRYNCPADPRVIVPKRSRMGWTVNFGHPSGVITIITMVFIGMFPPAYVAITEYPVPYPPHIFGAIFISVTISCALCVLLSRAQKR